MIFELLKCLAQKMLFFRFVQCHLFGSCMHYFNLHFLLQAVLVVKELGANWAVSWSCLGSTPTTPITSQMENRLGGIHKWRHANLEIFWPPPPSVTLLHPLLSDVIWEWSLSARKLGWSCELAVVAFSSFLSEIINLIWYPQKYGSKASDAWYWPYLQYWKHHLFFIWLEYVTVSTRNTLYPLYLGSLIFFIFS